MPDNSPVPMRMDVGQKVRIGIPKDRIWSTVRGWKSPHFILVDIPEDGTPQTLRVGTPCQMQYLVEGIIHRFDTEILDILGSSPAVKFISLRYPERIRTQNLRAFPRIKIKIPANVIDHKTQGWSCVVVDISSGGCGIEISGTTLSAGDHLVLSVLLPNQRLLADVPCVVKNTYGGYRYGLEFHHVNSSQKKVICEFQKIFEGVKPVNSNQEARGGIVGNLEDISLADLLQVMTYSRKAYQLDITDGTEYGRIYVKDGEIVHAKTSLLEGEDAIFELFLCTKAECRICKAESIPEQNVQAQLGHLLLEFACRLDEKGLEALSPTAVA